MACPEADAEAARRAADALLGASGATGSATGAAGPGGAAAGGRGAAEAGAAGAAGTAGVEGGAEPTGAAGAASAEGRGAAAAAEVHAEVPAAGARGAQASALKVFLERRRRQHAERGVTVALPALHAEWRRMLPAERDEFEREARGRRAGGTAAGAVAALLARQDRQPRAPLRRIDPNEPAPGKRRRVDKPEPEAAVPRPAFPAARAAAAAAAAGAAAGAGLAARARALRERAQGRGASLDLASSCGLDLAAVGAKLSAPALSFDCGQGAAPWAEEEEEGAAQAAGLEVCAPRDAKARSLMNSSLRQQISSVRVRQMLQRGCAPRAAGA